MIPCPRCKGQIMSTGGNPPNCLQCGYDPDGKPSEWAIQKAREKRLEAWEELERLYKMNKAGVF